MVPSNRVLHGAYSNGGLHGASIGAASAAGPHFTMA